MTRQQAIDAKCRDCIYDPESGLGTWKAQTDGCTSADCALWEYRPVTEATQNQRKQARIDAMSPEELRSYRERAEASRIRLSTTGKRQDGGVSGD